MRRFLQLYLEGVVAEQPVRIGKIPQPEIVLPARGLHPGSAVDPVGLVALEGVLEVRRRLDHAAGQHGGVFHRHCRALAHIGGHRMDRVAQQNDRPLAPEIERLADELCPAGRAAFGDRPQNAEQIGMGALEGFHHTVEIARDRGGIVRPVGHRRAGIDEVFLAVGGKIIVVAHAEFADFAPPFRVVGSLESVEQRGREDRAVADLAHIAGLLDTAQNLAHLRAKAVSADDDIGADRGAVREAQVHAAAGHVQVQQAFAELDRFGLQGIDQQGVKIAAMRLYELGAVFFLGFERMEQQLFSGIPLAAEPGAQRDLGPGNPIRDPDPLQNLDQIRAELDRGAEPGEFFRLFVQFDIESGALEQRRDSRSPDACPDDRNLRFARLSLLLTPSGAETLVFWVSQLLAWLVARRTSR